MTIEIYCGIAVPVILLIGLILSLRSGRIKKY